MSSCLSFQDLILATPAHETERLRRLLYLFTKQSVQLCATQDANTKERVVRLGEVAKPMTGPKGQIDEGERPFCRIGRWAVESFPRCLFGCCAIDVGDAEGGCLSGCIATDGEEVLGVGYELVLGCDTFMDEQGAIFGFLRAGEYGGDGVAYSGCSGNAEGCIASIEDCVTAVSVR